MPSVVADQVEFQTRYTNGYAWVTHEAVFGPRLFLQTRASLSRIYRDRQGNELTTGREFVLRDQRRVQLGSLSQDWHLRVNQRHDLKWGFEGRALDVDFDYVNIPNPRRPTHGHSGAAWHWGHPFSTAVSMVNSTRRILPIPTDRRPR